MKLRKREGIHAGIDVGGTKTLIIVRLEGGEELVKERVPTRVDADPEPFFSWLFVELNRVLAPFGLRSDDLAGIGIGFPGVISDDAGILLNAPAFRWPETDLRQVIRQYYVGKIYLDNDVNLAAWGERERGAARGRNNVLMITVGTGIGSALILNGQLYRGANGAAGEIGYWTLNVFHRSDGGNGNVFGQFENATSGTGIGALAREYFSIDQRKSSILDMVDGQIECIAARHVLLAASQGDAAALWIMEEPLSYMAIGIANAVSLLNPEAIVLGGGVADSGPFFIGELRTRARKFTPLPVNIVPAELGNEAGAYGAWAAVRCKVGP